MFALAETAAFLASCNKSLSIFSSPLFTYAISARTLTSTVPFEIQPAGFVFTNNILSEPSLISTNFAQLVNNKKHNDINFNFINILSYIKTDKISNDIYDVIIEKYMNIINNKKTNITNKITDIKQLIYLSKSVISDIQYFYKRLLSYLFKLPISDNIKIKLVKEFSDNDIMINNIIPNLNNTSILKKLDKIVTSGITQNNKKRTQYYNQFIKYIKLNNEFLDHTFRKNKIIYPKLTKMIYNKICSC